jgi:LacI family repressor for deo operon, udp, cdd, tsx, nupC, and nupG
VIPGTDDGSVSIVDVARRAGVSTSTVSRSLRGASNVSPATREKVLRAARELAYVPSPAASQLASGRTGAVGVIVPFVSRWFFAEVVTGAEAELRSAGADLLLYNLDATENREQFFTELPLRRRVDAVLAFAVTFSSAEESALAGLQVPVVTVGKRCGRFPWVGIDDRASAEMAVRHLLVLGHRDIAMISGLADDPLGRMTTLARQEGFRKALQEAGIEERPEQIVAEPWGAQGGMRAMERLLASGRLPTAVFAESDEMAFGANQVLRRTGLDVPGDISLIGFDDHEMAGPADLTTIAQPVREQGKLAAALVLDVLAGRPPGATEIILPTRLVVRHSTGPVRRTAAPARRRS